MMTRCTTCFALAIGLLSGVVATALAQQHRWDPATFPVATYVRMELDEPIRLDDMRAKYMPGLKWMRSAEGQQRGILRKYATRSDDGKTIGGVYLMESMAHARAFFTDELQEKLRQKYHATRVVVEHFWTTTILDNQAGTVTVGDQPIHTEQTPRTLHQGDGNAYTVVVQIPRATPMSAEKWIRSSLNVTPSYAAKEGLIRKYFLRSPDGKRIGGVYYFASQAAADHLINESWIAAIKKKTGTEPVVHRYQTPLVVDNVVGALYGG